MLPAARASASDTTLLRPQNRFRRRVFCRKPNAPSGCGSPCALCGLNCPMWALGLGCRDVEVREVAIAPLIRSFGLRLAFRWQCQLGCIGAVACGDPMEHRPRGPDTGLGLHGITAVRALGTAPCLAGSAHAEAAVDDLGVVGTRSKVPGVASSSGSSGQRHADGTDACKEFRPRPVKGDVLYPESGRVSPCGFPWG